MHSFEIGEGRTRLTVAWTRWGRDLQVHIGGGEHHIGAVALAGCTPEGQIQRHMVRIPPHKEGPVVEQAARTLHEATGVNVCVSSGIHLDDISRGEIDTVLRTAEEGVARLARMLRSEKPEARGVPD